jgi:hypothetical protein
MRNNQSSVKPNVFSIDYHLVHDGVSTETDLCANELNSLICLYRLIIKIGDLVQSLQHPRRQGCCVT